MINEKKLKIRDIFAISIINGLLSNDWLQRKFISEQKSAMENQNFHCRVAYQIADMMLEVREYPKEEINDQFLAKAQPIDSYFFEELSFRTKNILLKNGLRTVDDICKLSQRDLLNITGLGCKSLVEIKSILTQHGRQFLDV